MAVVNVNGISGINSITAQSNALDFYNSAGNTLSIGANLTGNVTGNATGLSGTPNITVGNIIASSATISGNVSVAGTLTYEDVTNVDSVGLVTARTGVRIDAGGLVVVGVTTVAAGSVSAPSITPTGDSNTGIFFPSADTVAIAEGGVEALRVDSSGNLGIGTNNTTIFGTAYRTVQLNPASGTGDGSAIRFMYDGGTANTNDLVIYTNYSQSYIRANGARNIDVMRNGSTVATFNANGIALPSGLGIDFSATANSSGSMASELFDDYEEGTWTPTIASTSSNVTYTIQSGQYTKIGRLVDFQFQININTVTSVGSGDFTIGGLPFTQGSNTGRYVIQTSDLDFDATKYSHYAYPDGSTGLKVLYTVDNGGWQVASATSFPVKAGSIITAKGSYVV